MFTMHHGQETFHILNKRLVRAVEKVYELAMSYLFTFKHAVIPFILHFKASDLENMANNSSVVGQLVREMCNRFEILR